MLLPGLKTACFPANPILAHWNGLERNGTLEHPTVPAAGAAPPGPPQASAAMTRARVYLCALNRAREGGLAGFNLFGKPLGAALRFVCHEDMASVE